MKPNHFFLQYRRLLLYLLLLTAALPVPLSAQQLSDDDEELLRAVTALRRQGQFEAAGEQAAGVYRIGSESGNNLLMALARREQAQVVFENPRTRRRDRIDAMQWLRESSRLFQRLGLRQQVAANQALLANASAEMPELSEVRTEVEESRTKLGPQNLDEQLDSLEVESQTLAALVAAQNATIAELNEQQVRQLLTLREQQRRLDSLSIAGLEDSLLLVQHEIALRRRSADLYEQQVQRNLLLIAGGAVLLIALVLYSRYRTSRLYQEQLEDKNRIIERERRRSDELLQNIMPAVVADELKREGRATARHFESVSVLFADFQGFTILAQQLAAEELIQRLDEVFRAFDAITDDLGLEKIKTMGDAYMCAAGLPHPTADHADLAVEAALRMQRYLAEQPDLSARIGIHSGPVVAGVVGSRKYAYDIWGETVNLAARLEAAGEPGKVNISAETCRLLGNGYTCALRGKLPVKNVGEMEMYFVEEVNHGDTAARRDTAV